MCPHHTRIEWGALVYCFDCERELTARAAEYEYDHRAFGPPRDDSFVAFLAGAG